MRWARKIALESGGAEMGETEEKDAALVSKPVLNPSLRIKTAPWNRNLA